MKDKLLLVGAGGFGRVVLEHVAEEYDVAFLDDGDVTEADGVPVIGNTNDMEKFFPEYEKLLVTIGNNALREKLYRRAAEIGYIFPNVIVSSAYVSPHAVLGNGIIVLNNAVVQNGAKIGDGSILNPGVEAHHDSTIGKYCLIYTNSVVRSLTHVGDRVWVGSTCTISTCAEVKADSLIEDGSVVKNKD